MTKKPIRYRLRGFYVQPGQLVLHFHAPVILMWMNANIYGNFAPNAGSASWKLSQNGLPVDGRFYLLAQNFVNQLKPSLDADVDYTDFELQAGEYTYTSSQLTAGGYILVLEKI